MRTIKFRAWNPELNKMSKPFSFGQILNFWDTNFKSLEPNKEIVMQFTGLHDKNGKEIYEGDILKTIGNNVKVTFGTSSKYPASFLMENRYVIMPFENTMAEISEIIGNVFENADLVKL